MDDQTGFAARNGEAFGRGRAARKRALGDNQGCVAVADIPSRALDIAGLRGLCQRVVGTKRSVFGTAPLGAPAAGFEPQFERDIKRGAISAGLAARNNAKGSGNFVGFRRSGQERPHQGEQDHQENR